MTRYRRPLAGATIALVVLVVGGFGLAARRAAGAPRQTRSLNGGVYTREQADRGAKLYKRICSECHQPDEFKGYLRRWVGLPVSYLYDSVSSTMPENNPGGLSRKRYVDLLTYLFAINGAPTGEQEMGVDAALLDDITIEVPPDKEVSEHLPGVDAPAVSAGARQAPGHGVRVTPSRVAPTPPGRQGGQPRRRG